MHALITRKIAQYGTEIKEHLNSRNPPLSSTAQGLEHPLHIGEEPEQCMLR